MINDPVDLICTLLTLCCPLYWNKLKLWTVISTICLTVTYMYIWVTHLDCLKLQCSSNVMRCVYKWSGLNSCQPHIHHCSTWSVALLCFWALAKVCVPGGMRLLQLLRQSSDTGKQLGEKLNPVASCTQWVKWWSIHQAGCCRPTV